MKILILANCDVGLLSFRQELIEALIQRGHDITVSLPPGNRLAEIKELGCSVDLAAINRRGTNPIVDFKLFRYYEKLLERLKPDVALTYTIKPNIYGGLACEMKGIPYIVNVTGLGSAVEKPGILQRITINLYRLAMRKANCIFFQNKGNKALFECKNINCKAHRLIPGSGANLKKFAVAPYPLVGPVKFLYISRIMKEKGIEEYFAAARHFRSMRKDVEFHILGACEEDYATQLASLAKEEIVVYHGQQKDVRPYLAEAGCLIHPTFYPEGMSNVVLEAASTGRPVITTRRHGCMEAVNDGETGFLFAERDTNGLLDAIDKFLALTVEQRAEMGRKARLKMEKEFDRNIVVNAYLEEIEKAAK